MVARHRLLQELSDGRFHSGQQLADSLGVSRAAVWKQLQRLSQDYDLQISAVRGRGYRLPAALELLDSDGIRAEIGDLALPRLQHMQLLECTASTNADATADLPLDSGYARVWLAEHQTGGRGRRGREWISAFGENLYLSLAWRFDLPMMELAGLSLVAGVVVAEVLREMGIEGHCLKWPNDVLVDGRKLCGILVEASGEAAGPAAAVIGIGINFRLPAPSAAQIDQPWVDLHRLGGPRVSRNQAAGMLIDRLINACEVFSEHRLPAFLDRWHAFDGLLGQDVCITSGKRSIAGAYRGIGSSGAVRIETASGVAEYHAGEVSLRGTTVL